MRPTDERFEMSQSIADFRIRSMMCAPLVNSEGEPLGVLQIDTLDQRKKFVGEDLEILLSVAAQAGIAINNAQLYEQALRQRAL
jgi:phosphoserine phosphatase RsbU/P